MATIAKKDDSNDRGLKLVRADLVAAEYSGASNLMFNELVKQWMKSGRKIYHFGFGQSPFGVIEVGVEALRQHAGENSYLEVQAGTAYTEEQLTALSNVFRKYDITVLSDEIYARLNYEGNHVTLAKVYPEGTIVSSGLSKWASAGGWRLGYHIFPKELSALKTAIKSAASHTYSCAPAPVQYAAIKLLLDEAACENYIRHTTRIMAAVADFCCRELQSVGVKMVKPRAGYYIFPDFEVIREPLRRRGVVTCEEMCALLLAEASVAVMAGGPSYLRPLEELTTRLCYVNFDGSDALTKSRHLGLDASLPESFVYDFCTPVYNGILALKNWVNDLLQEVETV